MIEVERTSASKTSRRARIFWLVCALLLVTPYGVSAQIQTASLEDLSRVSTAVVLGKTTGKRSYWNESRTRILTEVTLQVDEEIAGRTGSETTITIPGGRVGNTLYEVSDMPVFVEGEEVLVFLWQDDQGRNLVTGGVQGRLGVRRDEMLQQRVVTVQPPPVHEAATSTSGAATDESPEQVILLDQLVRQIKELREE